MGGLRRLVVFLPRRPLARLRLLLLLLLGFGALPVVASRTLETTAGLPLRVVSCAALVLLVAWYTWGYRRGSLPAIGLGVDAVLLLAAGAPLGGPLGLLGLWTLALAFRSLFETGWRGILPVLAYGLALAAGSVAAPLYAQSGGELYEPVQAPIFLAFGLVMWIMAAALRRQELALARQQLLTQAGAELVAASTRDDILAAADRGVSRLLDGRPAHMVDNGAEEVTEALRMPLAGPTGSPGVLLIEGLEPLPEDTREPLQALCTLIALRLEASEEGRRKQEKVESKVEQLAELNQLKDDLLNSVSFELRSPLTSIRAYSEMLLTYQDAAVQREFLEIINSESERLARMVNDVLDLTHIQSGSFQWNMSRVDVAALLHDAVRIYGPLVAREGLEFDQGVEDDLPQVSGDRDRLLQVIGNLLHNALKFTIRGSVGLVGYHAGQEVHIAVSDTGVGVPPAERERIFEKFHQAGPAPAGKAPGAGLGLAICRHIVEHHGGRIWVTPAPRGGSVFTFALPALAQRKDVPTPLLEAMPEARSGAR